MTLPCGCPDRGFLVDADRHAAWHAEIAPITTRSAKELRETRGMTVPPERTFIDDQFDVSRGITRAEGTPS